MELACILIILLGVKILLARFMLLKLFVTLIFDVSRDEF